MKNRKINFLKYALLSAGIISSINTYSQKKIEHRVVIGYNLGATAPIGIPDEVRAIEGYHPLLTPQIGYEGRYSLNEDWAIGAGLYFEAKGMTVRDKVKYMYTSVIPEEGEIKRMEGYFVGKNKTTVQITYATLPVFAIRKINENWQVRLGAFASYASSKKFNGTVSDGYMLRVEEGTDEIIDKVNISKASFDFGDDIRNFDFGLLGGAEMKVNHKISIYGNLSWSVSKIFPSDFRAVGFGMYNIYMALGVTHKL